VVLFLPGLRVIGEQLTTPFSANGVVFLPLAYLRQYMNGWLPSYEISRYSVATLANRRLILKNPLWFLTRRKSVQCGVMELRQFLAYLFPATSGKEELSSVS
jgi:hypothetical protein